MGLSFIERLKLLPGLRLVFSPSGMSASAGPEGVKIVHKLAGKHAGTTRLYAQKAGIRYTETLKKPKKKPRNRKKTKN